MDISSAGDLGANDFSALAVFLRADWVVKGVLIGLALASVWSWSVIVDKFFRIGALNRYANGFEGQISSGRSLEDIAADAGDHPRHALPRMLQAALREWREGRARAPAGAEGAVLAMIADVGGYSVGELARSSLLADDLGYDSLLQLRLIDRLRTEYPRLEHIRVGEVLPNIHCVGDLVDFVVQRLDPAGVVG